MMSTKLITLNKNNFRGKRTNLFSSASSSTSGSSAQSDVSFETFVNCHMRHPWGVIDYHLYLGHIEGGRDLDTRLGECYLFEKDGFRNIKMDTEMNFDNVPDKEHPIIVFLCLPVANVLTDFNCMLVMAWDYGAHKLQGYIFQTDEPLEDYQELWSVWSNGMGELAIEAEVQTFLATVKSAVQYEIEILDTGVLFHNGFSSRRFPSGFDAVVVVEYLQFIADFAPLLCSSSEEPLKDYAACERDLREVLMDGSREAWFAARKHLSVGDFRQKSLRQTLAMNFFWTQEARDPDLLAEMGQVLLDPHLSDSIAEDPFPPDPVAVGPFDTVDIPPVDFVRAPRAPRARAWHNASWVPNMIQMSVAFLFAICFLTAFDILVKHLTTPSRNTTHMIPFAWWPFAWWPFGEAQPPTGVFGHISKHLSTLGQWPLYQLLQRCGLFNFLPFRPEPQQMRRSKWWLLKQNIRPAFGWLPWKKSVAKPTVHDWLPFKAETRNMTARLFKWLPGKPTARRSGMSGKSGGWPAVTRTQSVPTGPFGVDIKPANSFNAKLFMG